MHVSELPAPRAALREATRRTLGAWKPHVLYGALVGTLGGIVLAPAGSWILMLALRVAAGGSVVNTGVAGLALSVRGVLLLFLWSALVGILVVGGAAGHAHIAALAGRTPRLTTILRLVIADLPRVPGAGGLKIAVLAAIGLPLIGAATTAVAGLLLMPIGGGEDLRDIVPRGLPVPLWMVGAGMAAGFLLFSWLYVRWSLAIPSLTLEGISLTQAVKRSVQRTRGSFWGIARAHLRHHVGMALLFAALVGLIRLVGRPIVGGLVADSPERGAIALAGLFVVFYALTGGLTILGVARLVTLTVVHHRSLGGGVDRAAPLATTGPRRRLSAATVVGGSAAAFGIATWLTLPHVTAELNGDARLTAVTAHRAGAISAPENTLAALRQAIADRADGAEIDVQQAKDGTVVVVHDPNLKRLAGVDRAVFDLDYPALAKLDVGSHHSPAFAGERIPTLEQAIDLVGDRLALNIELKTNKHETEAFIPDVVALLRRKQFLDRCVITSLEAPFLSRVREIEPRLKIGVIVTAKIGAATDMDVDIYSVQPLIATTQFIRKAHAQGREVHVWTVNDRADMSRFADRAADALITDAPRLAREVLDSRTPADGLRGATKRIFGLE